MCFDENDFVITNKSGLFVQTLQSIVKLNSNTMAIPGMGGW